MMWVLETYNATVTKHCVSDRAPRERLQIYLICSHGVGLPVFTRMERYSTYS
jgi:hypothetical protein